MKKYILILALAISPILSACSEEKQEGIVAQEAPEEEVRAEHYEAEKPQTIEAAMAQLNKNIAEIDEVLKSQEFGAAELEEVHEISYSLEAAVDKLAETKNVDDLDEAVQALHFASENQEEEKTRNWFAKLETAAGNIKDKSVSDLDANKTIYNIVIKNHKFSPEEFKVPAGKKIKLRVDNQDPTPEEFESHDMNREKIIGANKTATIFVGPLEPGRYHFFGEFNMDSANGYIIAE